MVREEDGFYIDDNNNKWDTYYYTLDEAEEISRSMINCFDCRNCRSCSFCRYCINCFDCRNCHNCSYCRACSNCCECKGCTYCADCMDCIDCGECAYCRYCSSCKGCRGCAKFSTNPQRITGPAMGSRYANPTVYWVKPGEEQCVVGCFSGTLNDLERAVRIRHEDNQKHLTDYLTFIESVRCYQKALSSLTQHNTNA